MKFSAALFCALTLSAPGVAAVASAAPATISTIQGAGAQSPLLDQIVTVEGIVTGDFSGPAKFDGFFNQDPNGDENPATSDGLFVYINARSRFAAMQPRRGDRMRITGRVGEFKGQTQIGSPTRIEVLAHETPIEPLAIQLQANVNWEALESMLVRFDQTLVVIAQNDLALYGTLRLSPARSFHPTNQRTIEEVRADPQPPISILLDDGSGDANPQITPYLDDQNTRRAGSTLRGLVGVV